MKKDLIRRDFLDCIVGTSLTFSNVILPYSLLSQDLHHSNNVQSNISNPYLLWYKQPDALISYDGNKQSIKME